MGREETADSDNHTVKLAETVASGALRKVFPALHHPRTLEEKLTGQKQIKSLEAFRSQKRRSLFDAQDEVEVRRDVFIRSLEEKLVQRRTIQNLFRIRWGLH